MAHQIETMARQKKLRSVSDYLKPVEKSNATDARIFAALKLAEAKGLVTIRERIH